MVEPSHPYVAPSHCLNPAQRVSETCHSPSDEADGKLCRFCLFALPSRQPRLFWVHWQFLRTIKAARKGKIENGNTKRYAVHTEASNQAQSSRVILLCMWKVEEDRTKFFFLLAMTRYPAADTVVKYFFRNFNGSARSLNMGMYHTIDMVLSEV